MGNNSKKYLKVYLLLAVVIFLVSMFYINKNNNTQKYKQELIAVCVAKKAIPARTLLNKEWLELKKIPRDYVLTGVIYQEKEAYGKVTAYALLPGEQLTKNKLSARSAKLGLSFVVPKDQRAVAVNVDASASIAGLIKPGDAVDVVCTLHNKNLDKTIAILQNVKVIAIDQQIETDAKSKEAGQVKRSLIATFALDLHDAEKLIMAESKGSLKLLLRPVDDENIVESRGVAERDLLPPVRRVAARAAEPAQYIKVIKGTDIQNKKL